MNKNTLEYEPPKAKIYRFNTNDRILTESGIEDPTDVELFDFAADALNNLFGGTNTTMEKE